MYEAACLECHKPGGKGRTVCDVSARENCLGCHMPAVDTGQGIMFTDHWIRVREHP
jgi:mono/diheme cytochrome c family protein